MTQREMTPEEREWFKKAKAEVDSKIAEGILPEWAEPAMCLTVGCKHPAHGLEKVTAARS